MPQTYDCQGGEGHQFVVFYSPPGYHITQVRRAPYTGPPGGMWWDCGTEAYLLSNHPVYLPKALGLPEPTGGFLFGLVLIVLLSRWRTWRRGRSTA